MREPQPDDPIFLLCENERESIIDALNMARGALGAVRTEHSSNETDEKLKRAIDKLDSLDEMSD